MSSKVFGARYVTLTLRPKGAAAPTPWSLPRTRLAPSAAPCSAGRIWGMCRRRADDMDPAPHRTTRYIRPQNEPEESGSTC
jgi:hypothetical protein